VALEGNIILTFVILILAILLTGTCFFHIGKIAGSYEGHNKIVPAIKEIASLLKDSSHSKETKENIIDAEFEEILEDQSRDEYISLILKNRIVYSEIDDEFIKVYCKINH
tara:strand:- start:2218 stop:2547 length:330 start_codon:yes stop_codon:yes gene_type:complete